MGAACPAVTKLALPHRPRPEAAYVVPPHAALLQAASPPGVLLDCARAVPAALVLALLLLLPRTVGADGASGDCVQTRAAVHVARELMRMFAGSEMMKNTAISAW